MRKYIYAKVKKNMYEKMHFTFMKGLAINIYNKIK